MHETLFLISIKVIDTKVNAWNFIIYVKKAAEFISGLRINAEITQIMLQAQKLWVESPTISY